MSCGAAGHYYVIGADIAINHSAVVILDSDAGFASVRYLCSKKMDEKRRLGGRRVIVRRSIDKDKASFEMRRLHWLYNYYLGIFAELLDLDQDAKIFMAMEDYAYGGSSRRGRAGQGSHQLGEVGGVVKLISTEAGVRLRLYDPTTLKLFTAGMGNATKDEMRDAILTTYADEFRFDQYPSPGKENDSASVLGDVVDAYALARMVLLEKHVRDGRVMLQDLDESKRRIFLRVTKTYPVNLLDRPWIEGT